MMKGKIGFWVLTVWFCWLVGAVSSQAGVNVQASVDATDLPRGLLKASCVYPVSGGAYGLYYPKWLEGVHGPTSPIQNLAEIAVYTQAGERIAWRRDPLEVTHFWVDVPPGVQQIVVKTTYICNQPNAGSMGVDSHGTSRLGILCWNTCLLYPEGHDISDIRFDLQLVLPPDWQWGSSLTASSSDGNNIHFQPVSYRELVDSPLICGLYYRRFDLTPAGGTPHYLHLIADSKHSLDPEAKAIDGLRKMVAEAMALFGAAHDYDYHFLLVLSDCVPFLGLEHLRSSLNAVPENGLEEDQMHTTGHLITHEYGHRWCGKYHRPAGMVTADHHRPNDTRLLWVYEGLDQYLGVVLTARSGLFATKEYSSFEGALRDDWVGVGHTLTNLIRQKGRRSIHLEDTASSSHLRRRWGTYWTYLNRAQDYYFEGALLWYEIDAILREQSQSTICLDDFVRGFLGRYDRNQEMMAYTEENVIEALNEVLSYDWAALIEDRVRGWHEEMPLEVLLRMGYRLEFSNKPTDYDSDPSLTSLGMSVAEDGKIRKLVPDGPADRAGLYEGVEILGVNKRKYSANRLRDAVADSASTRTIELLLLKGDEFETVRIPYDGGLKYMDFVRDENKPDRFAEIFASRVK